MKVKDYLAQNDVMVIKNLPKYVYSVSSLETPDGEMNMLFSFSLAHPDLLNGKLSEKEKIDLAMDQEVMGQIAVSLSVLKKTIKQMQGNSWT